MRPAEETEDILERIAALEVAMRKASKALEFEQAAVLRDEIARLKRLVPDDNSPVALTARPKTGRR
jgi:protein-arginine kinase activator protein McsA